MKFARLMIVAGALVCAACASSEPAPTPEPSPRAECAEAVVTVYFTEESATLQPTTGPLLRDLMDRVGACQGAGGALRQITVTPFPDADARGRDRRDQIELRGQRVRAALVEAGAPASAILIRHPRRGDGDGIMQRRAEIVADLW